MASSLQLEGKEWDAFRRWFADAWEPGQHVSIVAPTGTGKSTLAVGILPGRRFVLGLDPKGGDETLAKMRMPRLPAWPGEQRMLRLIDENERKGRPSRYIIGPAASRREDLPKLRQATADALDGGFDMGGWTIYCDELQIVCDRTMMNLAGPVKRILVAARSKGVSFVSSFQAPSWVPLEAVRQPTWIIASHTRDKTVVDRTAEILGRPKPEIRGIMAEIDPYHWIVVSRDPRAPVIVTSPPKLG